MPAIVHPYAAIVCHRCPPALCHLRICSLAAIIAICSFLICSCLGPTSLTSHAPTSRESSRFLHPAQWLLYLQCRSLYFSPLPRFLFCRCSNTTPTPAALPSSFIGINEEEDVGGFAKTQSLSVICL